MTQRGENGMRRAALWVIGLFVLGIAGLVFGQDSPPASFERYRQIGSIPPVGVRYDAERDQIALVRTSGSLSLFSAGDLSEKFELYESGAYNAYEFSHDGRWLALAIDRRIELWDTAAGQVITSIEPPGSNYVTGPLMFSDDDSYLVFTAVVPASQATRRSENDIDLLPWLWDVHAALDLADSRLPGRVDAYAFFDYRSGSLFLGPNDILLAAIPGRYQLIDANADALISFQDIESERFENDPVSLWFSAAGDLMYVLKTDTGNIVQVDTRARQSFELPLGRELNGRQMSAFEAFSPSGVLRVMGQGGTGEIIPLVRDLFGYDYRADWNYHPLTITLLDILQPETAAARQTYLLLHIFDEARGVGSVEFITTANGQQMAMHPDGDRLTLRDVGQASPITVYDLDSGQPVLRFETSLADSTGDALLAYNAAGDSIQAGWQRYDASSGAVQYEALDFSAAFVEFYFSDDSRKLVTMTDSEWWLWDIATDTLLRRERLEFTGARLATWRDGQRFLLVSSASSNGVEIYDIGKGERQRLDFETPPDMTLTDVVPSPSWGHYLVVYAANQATQHSPNGAIALYSMGIGQRAFIAGADLPANLVDYGWIDDTTAYITGSRSGGGTPDRVYGIEYDPSGAPACLLAAHPAGRETWIALWERIAYYRSADDVARLAQAVCAAPDEAAVLALHTPTPTVTPVPEATSAMMRLAGVPACLTQSFTDEALAFAREWRNLTEGMSADEMEALSDLLCEGLSGEYAGGYAPRVGAVSDTLIYAIRVETGERVLLSALPAQVSEAPALDIVREAFRRQFGFIPADAAISPDRRLLVVRSTGDHALIYALDKPYDAMIAEATATAAGTAQAIPNAIRVRPTATALPDMIGTALPTLTPTFIPTALPAVNLETAVPEIPVETVEEVCPWTQARAYADRSAVFAPTGRLIGIVPDSGVMWTLDMTNARLYPDETLPRCAYGLPCEFSSDQNWILILGGDIAVARPDGSDRTVLMTRAESEAALFSAGWADRERVYLDVSGYLPQIDQSERVLRQYYDVNSRTFSEPAQVSEEIDVNGLPTEVVSLQPLGGALRIVRTPVVLPNGTGYRYYLYDATTGHYEMFAEARPEDSHGVELYFEWDPTGTRLYYTPPLRPDYGTGVVWDVPRTISYQETLMVFDTRIGAHTLTSFRAMDEWSRDARYRYGPYYAADQQERLDAGLPVPTLRLQDVETGQVRLYCPPERIWDIDEAAWSPDGRYVALRALQTGDQSEATRQFSTVYILDLDTGEIIDMQADMNAILVWTMEEGGYGG